MKNFERFSSSVTCEGVSNIVIKETKKKLVIFLSA